MGEESTSRPPAAKKARMTCVHCARAGGSWPTLKVIQVPRPTSGMASPLAGMARVAGRAWARAGAAAPAADHCRKVRRFIRAG